MSIQILLTDLTQLPILLGLLSARLRCSSVSLPFVTEVFSGHFSKSMTRSATEPFWRTAAPCFCATGSCPKTTFPLTYLGSGLGSGLGEGLETRMMRRLAFPPEEDVPFGSLFSSVALCCPFWLSGAPAPAPAVPLINICLLFFFGSP